MKENLVFFWQEAHAIPLHCSPASVLPSIAIRKRGIIAYFGFCIWLPLKISHPFPNEYQPLSDPQIIRL
jgi:hypothetical protein